MGLCNVLKRVSELKLGQPKFCRSIRGWRYFVRVSVTGLGGAISPKGFAISPKDAILLAAITEVLLKY